MPRPQQQQQRSPSLRRPTQHGVTTAAAASSDQPPTFSREASPGGVQQVESAASTWERQIEQRLIGRTDSEQPSEGGSLSRQPSAAGSASALRDPEAEEEEVGID